MTAEQQQVDSSDEEIKKFRVLSGSTKSIVFTIAVLFSLYHLYIIYFPMNTIQVRAIHLMFGLVLIFLLVPISKTKKHFDRIPIYDILITLTAIAACIYVAVESLKLSNERLGNYTLLDVIVSTIIVTLVIEATRRILGWTLPIISLFFIAYAYFGYLIPGTIGNAGFSFKRIVTSLSLWTEGILGTPLGVSASYVTLFVIFAVFLQQSGAGQYFIDLALSIFGRYRGGPAKVSVVASSLFGSVSGSAVANVAGTGTLTIPLMKKNGFKKEEAAGIEAVSSTGGQLMPPIMGAAAFVMAEILSIPFVNIIIAALIPAILYYLAVFISVDLKALKNGALGLPKNRLPVFIQVLKERWHLSIPLVVLIYLLAYVGTSPGKAAFWAIVSSVIVTMFRKATRMNVKDILKALEKGAYAALEIVSVCACAGIIIGVFTLTGLGLKFSGIMIDLAQGNLLLLLIFTMIACLIAGMGVPTVAAYLIVAVLVAPALVRLGIEPLAAHLFVFYFAIISAITPPVSLASYVAAGIAGSHPFKTSITAFKIGLAGFVIPFMFVYNPALIMIGTPLEIGLSVISALFGIILLAGAIEGYFYYIAKVNHIFRVLLFIASISLIHPNQYTDLLGILIFALFLLFIVLYKKETFKKKIIEGGVDN